MKKLRNIIFISLPIIYMALIWYLSSQPSDAVFDTGWSFDSLLKESLHLVEFAILYLLLRLAFSTRGPISKKLSYILAGFAIAYGLLDEIHQYFVPSRSATVIDFVKDTFGVLAAWWGSDPAKIRQNDPNGENESG